jgi:hypothetical protein
VKSLDNVSGLMIATLCCPIARKTGTSAVSLPTPWLPRMHKRVIDLDARALQSEAAPIQEVLAGLRSPGSPNIALIWSIHTLMSSSVAPLVGVMLEGCHKLTARHSWPLSFLAVSSSGFAGRVGDNGRLLSVAGVHKRGFGAVDASAAKLGDMHVRRVERFGLQHGAVFMSM